MQRVLILGAGGHAQVVADILLRTHKARTNCQPIGFLDDNPSLTRTAIMGLPVLGAIAQLEEFDHDAVIVAIGDNVILNTGCTVDHHNRIGDHAHVAPGVHLGGDVTIGEGTLVGIGTTVIPQRTVGSWSVIGAGSVVSKDIPAHATATGMPEGCQHE